MSSDRARRFRRGGALGVVAVIGACLSAEGVRAGTRASPASGGEPRLTFPAGLRAIETLMTRDEALALAFPRCEIERQTKYLTDPQRAAVAELAGVPFAASVVYPYRATRDGKLVGVAYLETHRVRSLRETLMVVVTPDDKIRRVEVLAFAEPKDYLPRSIWYDQFKGRGLDKDLELHRKIRNVTGATLSGRAATLCARRVLALHKTLARIEAEEAERKEAERDAKKKEAGKGKDEKGSGGGGAGSGPVH